ncbi:undecaprenyldiphospho-muramoylpentapeptide beta-N-acetylglucosaminyltransferase [Solitalea koreensis]|uniref:UDP-N-acetylglucosamine--N-acetylmuramyl-(pentapeptide) pyrophosphoryl-undecaprenol N-acetylglucosamine transferase n=1 Tax=Solitalea koreensis TaxID=543615 RepID=A0A521E442_9SPHI|nr:undecaprenyldiphospho-muramoylpentapeptide beta-N-acetylglucosaminyltransferase [Solitalea koreensis]SMO78622.1 UDP-N-acetylglucosamine-N-acetylmuramylpentapeptide N-acetylglucosamine transferase [Solitalea koreensis]
MSKKNTRIVISGGGTGGHLFPALAIADALKKIDPAVELLFVGALGKIEMDKVPAAGYKIIGLDIKGLQRSFTTDNLKFPVRLIKSLLKAFSIVRSFKPDVAVGVGGYASGPLLYAASLKGIPTVVQEQNSYPGITNKLLAKRAIKICVAYEGMEKFFPADKLMLTGNPVRQDILEIGGKREEAFAHFNLSPEKKTIFLTGGSLGARTLNEGVLNHLEEFKDGNVQLIWQCGKFYYNSLKEKFNEQDYPNVKLLEFVSRVDLAYAAADVMIARAGASTISELCLVKKPAVLVPSPNVAEDHQTKNAMALVSKQAAILVKDEIAKSELIPVTLRLLNNEDKKQKLAENLGKLALLNSADVIAKEILKLVKR